MRRRRRFGFDIDGPRVSDNWRMRAFFIYLQELGIECSYEVYLKTGEWPLAVPHLPWATIYSLWEQYAIEKKIADVPTPGAIAALAALTDADRVIATARTSRETVNTRAFIEQHYGLFTAWYFELQCKVAIALELDAIIDDNFGIVKKIASEVPASTKVILFPTPDHPRRRPHPRAIILEAEDHDVMYGDEETWRKVRERAWEEIISILQPVSIPA